MFFTSIIAMLGAIAFIGLRTKDEIKPRLTSTTYTQFMGSEPMAPAALMVNKHFKLEYCYKECCYEVSNFNSS